MITSIDSPPSDRQPAPGASEPTRTGPPGGLEATRAGRRGGLEATRAGRRGALGAPRAGRHRLLLRSGDGGWLLLGMDGEVVFHGVGLRGRRQCLEFARDQGVIAVLS